MVFRIPGSNYNIDFGGLRTPIHPIPRDPGIVRGSKRTLKARPPQ
jgi:hypothetical protein